MARVAALEKVRRDGRLWPHDLKEIAKLVEAHGREPTTTVRWRYALKPVAIRNAEGDLDGIIAPGEQFVAVTHASQPFSRAERLIVFNGDGTTRHEFGTRVYVRGNLTEGAWGWFEKPYVNRLHRFACVFTAAGGPDWRLEIDANTGQILEAFETR